ncbi:hypothetical protein OIO90_003239 [Microbotryomycetes sp. JL221]|nr:hypothetical protein OIO90_003239 [Microbotryomycetes sp. JL221]
MQLDAAAAVLLARQTVTNPFSELLETLESAVYPDPSSRFGATLNALFAVLSLALLGAIVHGLLVLSDLRRRRHASASVWLIKTVQTSNGRFIVMNTRILSCFMSIFNLLFCIASEIYVKHLLYDRVSFEAMGVFRGILPVTIIIHLVFLSFGPLQAYMIDPSHFVTLNADTRARRARWFQPADLLNAFLIGMTLLSLAVLVPASVLTYYNHKSWDLFKEVRSGLEPLSAAFDPTKPIDAGGLLQLLQNGQVLQSLKAKTYKTYIAEFTPLCVLCLLLAVVNVTSLCVVSHTRKQAEQRVRQYPDAATMEEKIMGQGIKLSKPVKPASVALAAQDRKTINMLEPVRSETGSIMSATSHSSRSSSTASIPDRTLMVDITKLSRRQLHAIAGKAEHGIQGEKARQLLTLYTEGRDLIIVASLFLALSILGFGLAVWFLSLVAKMNDERWSWSTQEAINTAIQWSYGSALVVIYPVLIYGTWKNLPESPNAIVWPHKCLIRRAVLAIHYRIQHCRDRTSDRVCGGTGGAGIDSATSGFSPTSSSAYGTVTPVTAGGTHSRRNSIVAAPYSARRAPYSPTASGHAPSGRVKVVIQEIVTEEYRIDGPLVPNNADVSPFFVEQEDGVQLVRPIQQRSIETVIEGGVAAASDNNTKDADETERTLGSVGGLGIGVGWINRPNWAVLEPSMSSPSTNAIVAPIRLDSTSSATTPVMTTPMLPTRARLSLTSPSPAPNRLARRSVDSLSTTTSSGPVGLPKITSAIAGAIPWEWSRGPVSSLRKPLTGGSSQSRPPPSSTSRNSNGSNGSGSSSGRSGLS